MFVIMGRSRTLVKVVPDDKVGLAITNNLVDCTKNVVLYKAKVPATVITSLASDDPHRKNNKSINFYLV